MRSPSIFGIVFVFLFSMHIQMYASETPPVTIHLDAAGTLPSKISGEKKDLITDLTITGNVNGTDIRFIREMAGGDSQTTSGKLARLDLSTARIVRGGDFYDNFDHITKDDIIGTFMFSNCRQLTELIIPESVRTIESYAFWNCEGLKSMVIPPAVKIIQEEAFTKCIGITTLSLPQNLEELGKSAFSTCESLTSIFIPGGINTLNKKLFYNCLSLNEIYIPDNITTIEDDVFEGCSALKSIEIGNNVTTITSLNQFNGLKGLTEFIVKAGNPGYCSVDGVLFTKDKKTLLSYPAEHSVGYVIPNSITTISSYAFSNSVKLTSVTIPNSVEIIEAGAFTGCSGLTEINIPDRVSSIGNEAFSNCTTLTAAIIPNSVSKLGEKAFAECWNLDSVSLGSGISSLNYGLFLYCRNLTDLVIPKNIKTINYATFYGCSGLKEIHCLSLVPPVASGKFSGIPDEIKLYVPKGTYSAYWIAKGWEDLDIFEKEQGEGADIYFRVSASANRGGSIQINNQTVSTAKIKKGEPVSMKIIPEEGYEINQVVLNGKDITSDLENQVYTLSSINDNLSFNILFRELPVYLFLQHADNGQIKQLIQKGGSYTYQIVPAENWSIHSVTFNENVVTDELDENNTFITPSIYNNSYLNVTFENTGESLSRTANSNMKVYSVSGKLIIEGLRINDNISIYNESGILIKGFSAIREREEIELPAHHIYMVKGNGKTIKAAL